jgi:hypothetical protein
MQELKNPKEKIKENLTLLKGKFTGDPFTSENYVKPEFMFFVVDYYMNILADIRKHCDYVPTEDPNGKD